MQYSYLNSQDAFFEPRPGKKPSGVIKTDHIFASGVKLRTTEIVQCFPTFLYTITMCNNNVLETNQVGGSSQYCKLVSYTEF